MRGKAVLTVVAVLAIIGACNDSEGSDEASDQASAASMSAAAASPSLRTTPTHTPSPSRTQSSAAVPASTTPPPARPVSVQPFTYVGQLEDEPAQGPVPALPTDPGATATLSISTGWTGGLQTSGPAAAAFVRCQVIHASLKMGGDRLMYEVSSDGRFTEFVHKGEYYVNIVRRVGSGDWPIATEVHVWSRTATDEHYEMWDSTGVVSLDEQQISVAASADNRTFAFSSVVVPLTYFSTIDPDAGITYALVQGTVGCPQSPGPIPGV